MNAGIKELQAEHAGYQKEVGKLKGNMAAAATALEAVRSNRRGLLEQATLEQVRGACSRPGGGSAVDEACCHPCPGFCCRFRSCGSQHLGLRAHLLWPETSACSSIPISQ